MRGKSSFASSHRAKFWDYEKNDKKPEEVSLNSRTKFWFNCEDCGHSISKKPQDITQRDTWCPYCSGKLCEDEDCDDCHQKSFASHPRAKDWSKRNDLTPRQVSKGSTTKYYFNCDVCGHELHKNVRNTTQGKWCAYCYRTKMCFEEDCDMCFEYSFASHEKVKYWSKKNKVNPRHVFRGKQEKFLFDCPCGHEISISLESIHKGYWCQYCCRNSVKMCKDKNCKLCTKKTFATHPKVEFWDYTKNKKSPTEVFKGGNYRAHFICAKGHKFRSMLNSVNSGSWCPTCKNKTQAKLHEIISDYYDLQKKTSFDWCRNKRGILLPFDICLKWDKIIIELDGGQHFKQVRDWKSPKEQQENDKYKMKRANKNGYSVIRLLQEDVYYDRNNWLHELLLAIGKIHNQGKVQNIFICSNGEYDSYRG